jgi:hypothetical protein
MNIDFLGMSAYRTFLRWKQAELDPTVHRPQTKMSRRDIIQNKDREIFRPPHPKRKLT